MLNNTEVFIGCIIILLICIPGLIGNGIVIWLLGFNIKRNPFTTYIFNLSIADFGMLTIETIRTLFFILNVLHELSFKYYINLLHHSIFLFTFMTSQLLLTIISTDRCVCLFFPLWHRCHRPPHLSTAVCLIIWLVAFLISVTDIILIVTLEYYWLGEIQFYLNFVVSMPIMCVSTISMLIEVCIRSQQKKWGKMLRAILITLVFFLLFALPINVAQSLKIFQKTYDYFSLYAYICATLNSTINPMIYYLVGRDKTESSNRRMHVILDNLFKEEEHYREEQETSTEAPL
ncbi:proto-oncogene Mas-like [Anolis sagrei]|uniref:proto-oncogene Mas-like n=1 Tax=Anolis sagrei TaxID=38937 RepID=UPI003522E117